MSRALRIALCVMAAIACAMAFSLDGAGFVGVSDAPASATSYLWSALAAAFLWLFFHVFVRRGLRPSVGAWVFGMLFGVLNAFATTLFAYDTWSFLNGALAWAKQLYRCAGQGLPMVAALAWACDALAKERAPRLERPGRFVRLHRLYAEHTTAFCAALFALCWLPYLAAFYPGTVIWDMGEMIAQFFGERELTTWHPVFTTGVFGGCVWLGRLLGSDNIGTFLFTLLQTALLAYALGASVHAMRRFGAGRAAQAAAICFFALTPIFASFAQAVGKDTLYAALLLLFTLRTLLLLREPSSLDARRAIGYGVTALLTCLVRSNGVYVILPTALATVLVAARGKPRRLAAIALGAAIACALVFSSVLLPALGVKDETASGLYSVCFQQSARTLRDHADTVTADEYAAIDAVLDAERLPALYEPGISDPVKFTFRQYGQGAAAEKTALAPYRDAWLAMLGKYPVTYLEAFVAGNSGYYTLIPKIDSARTYNYQGGIRFVFETYSLGDDPRLLHTTQLPALAKARSLLAAYARGWRHIPLLQLLLGCGVYTWALVAAGLSLARRKRWRELVGFLPALLSLGVCMLSPVNDYFRYFLPIVAMTPALLAYAKEAVAARD